MTDATQDNELQELGEANNKRHAIQQEEWINITSEQIQTDLTSSQDRVSEDNLFWIQDALTMIQQAHMSS